VLQKLPQLREYYVWAALVKRVAENHGARVLATLDLVCGQHWCPCIVKDVLQMWDNNHLTYQYLDFIGHTVTVQLVALGFLASRA
jgi:hypothetical protein